MSAAFLLWVVWFRGELTSRGPALSHLLSFSPLTQSEIRVCLKVGFSCPLFVAVVDCILCFGLIVRIPTLKINSVGWLFRSYITHIWYVQYWARLQYVILPSLFLSLFFKAILTSETKDAEILYLGDIFPKAKLRVRFSPKRIIEQIL